MSNISNYFLVGFGLLAVVLRIVVWLGKRAQRRVIANIENPEYRDCDPSQLPDSLCQWIDEVRPELEEQGFRDLLTGNTRSMTTGEHDTYTHAFTSADGMASWDFVRMVVQSRFGFLPPDLGRWFASESLAASLETVFEDDSMLITANRAMPGVDAIPGFYVLELSEAATMEEIWQAHQREVASLMEMKKCGWWPLNTRDAHFAKERLQRERLTQHETQLLAKAEARNRRGW